MILNEIKQIENHNSFREKPGACRRKYKNNLLQITGTAIGGHIACGTTDITVVLGSICHAAVLVVQYAAIDNALMDYEECLTR